jgi:hypothetical protein
MRSVRHAALRCGNIDFPIRFDPDASIPMNLDPGSVEAPADRPNTPEDSIVARVLRWRLAVLVGAGYDPEDAAELAAHPGVDLHEALDLVQNGCPPKVALRILR